MQFERTLIETRARSLRYPEIPSVYELRIITTPPPKEKFFIGGVTWHHPAKRILWEFGQVDDLKVLSDLVPNGADIPPLPEDELRLLQIQYESKPAEVVGWFRGWVSRNFSSRTELIVPTDFLPAPLLGSGALADEWRAAWNYADDWAKFLRTVSNPHPQSTIIDMPYPFLIPAGRFQEWYYWDTWPAVEALLLTNRDDLAFMQIENLLEMIRHFGFPPNGGRTYYLTRSQPPVIYRLVREVVEKRLSKANAEEREQLLLWVKRRALPLLSKSYFDRWRNPNFNHDPLTGLAHWWSEVDSPRIEKHGKDNDSKYGRTSRAVKAACESGRDFTEAFEGCADDVGSVFLNSLLYEAENAMAWLSGLVAEPGQQREFSAYALERKHNVNKWLWNETDQRYQNIFLDKKNAGKGRRLLRHTTAEAFSPYKVGIVRTRDAVKIRALRDLYDELLSLGGISASDRYLSYDQWDGENVWAPDNLEAADAMFAMGYISEAKEIALRFNSMVRDEHSETGFFYERYNGRTRKRPTPNAHQYPVQEGFLWTNAAFIIFGIKYLNFSF